MNAWGIIYRHTPKMNSLHNSFYR